MSAPRIVLPTEDNAVEDIYAYWHSLISRVDPANLDRKEVLIEEAKLAILTKIAIELQKLNMRPTK